MKVVVLMNAAAGPALRRVSPDRIREAFTATGVEVVVNPTPAVRLSDAARAAAKAGVDVVAAAGGDGTVNAVAAGLVGGDVPLGVLPLGTLNHFALTIGIPRGAALEDAAAVIAGGNVTRVDVGEVNGQIFLNNSSIGLYPRIVVERDEQREVLGRNKWTAFVSASMKVFRRLPISRVRIDAEGRTRLRHVPFVFIGNNEYQMNLFAPGRRARLDGGKLCLYIATSTGRFALVRLMMRTAVGLLEQSRDFESLLVTEAFIDTGKKSVRVAVDGEISPMIPPLHYRIRPRSLRVLVPADRL